MESKGKNQCATLTGYNPYIITFTSLYFIIPRMMFINHCHVFPEGVFDKENPYRGTIDSLEDLMSSLGVEKAVLFPPFGGQGMLTDSNRWLKEELNDRVSLYGFVTIDPKLKNAAETLKMFVKEGFVGAKIHPPIYRTRIDEPRCEKFYETAQELNVPVLFHTGVHGWTLDDYRPLLIDRIAQKYPNLKIIIEHIGGTAFFYEALAVLENNPNCYAGISSTFASGKNFWYVPLEKIEFLIQHIGSNRVIYGADYPYNGVERIKTDINIIGNMNINDKDKCNILGKTLESILKID